MPHRPKHEQQQMKQNFETEQKQPNQQQNFQPKQHNQQQHQQNRNQQSKPQQHQQNQHNKLKQHQPNQRNQQRPQNQQHQQQKQQQYQPKQQQPAQQSQPQAQSQPSQQTAVTKNHLVTETTFSSFNLSSALQRALTEQFQYTYCSPVQQQCIPIAMQGVDVLGKAKTGTGKTLAFLLPTLHLLMTTTAKHNKAVRALVISPTRELAQQIETEAQTLTTFATQYRIACFVGGTNIGRDQKSVNTGCDIVIATPGRLLDLLQNTQLATTIKSVQMLVLDEADRLLDMGFQRDLDAILQFLPAREQRQTLLFSATVPDDIVAMTKRVLRSNYKLIDCVGEAEVQTHQVVKQEYMICTLNNHIEVLYELLAHHTKQPNHKIMVFFTTARVTQNMSELFNAAGMRTLELHSRLSQSKRTKVSDQFRDCNSGILFSSDVSARGLDYPGVTLVIQVGLTEPEQYVHRVGRTGRAGASGEGLLLLCDFEQPLLQKLKQCPIKEADTSAMPKVQALLSQSTTEPTWQIAPNSSPINRALSSVTSNRDAAERACQAYGAWLGFYNSNGKTTRWSKEQLVATANQYARIIGLDYTPALQAKTVGKMQLKGVAGIVLEGGGRNHRKGGYHGGQQQDGQGKNTLHT